MDQVGPLQARSNDFDVAKERNRGKSYFHGMRIGGNEGALSRYRLR